MKISNFKLVSVCGSRPLDWRFKATVDVTDKMGFFSVKKTVTRQIYKIRGGSWYFVDTGEFTPGREVEHLVKMLEAKKGKNLEECTLPILV
jgi:hypothetical protein